MNEKDFDKFDELFDNFELEDEYAEYLMENSCVPIPNGDMLTKLMEGEYMKDDFKVFYRWFHALSEA